MIEEVDSDEEEAQQPQLDSLTLKEQLTSNQGPLPGDGAFDRGQWGGMYDIDEDDDDAACAPAPPLPFSLSATNSL